MRSTDEIVSHNIPSDDVFALPIGHVSIVSHSETLTGQGPFGILSLRV